MSFIVGNCVKCLPRENIMWVYLHNFWSTDPGEKHTECRFFATEFAIQFRMTLRPPWHRPFFQLQWLEGVIRLCPLRKKICLLWDLRGSFCKFVSKVAESACWGGVKLTKQKLKNDQLAMLWVRLRLQAVNSGPIFWISHAIYVAKSQLCDFWQSISMEQIAVWSWVLCGNAG